jgi:hypothetical protein
LIDYLLFTSRSRIFHRYRDVTTADEGLHNLGLRSALRTFELGGIFIVPHLLRNGVSVSTVRSEGPRHSVASYDTQKDVMDLLSIEASLGGGGGGYLTISPIWFMVQPKMHAPYNMCS